MPVAIRFSSDIEARLKKLAKSTDRSMSFYIKKAVQERLDDFEDIYLAEREIEKIKSGESKIIPANDVWGNIDLED